MDHNFAFFYALILSKPTLKKYTKATFATFIGTIISENTRFLVLLGRKATLILKKINLFVDFHVVELYPFNSRMSQQILTIA